MTEPDGNDVVFAVRRVHLVAVVVAVVAFAAGTAAGIGWTTMRRGGGEVIRYASDPQDQAMPSLPEPIAISAAGRPALGPAGAAVTVVEFTDYECPFCRRHYQETFAAVQERYGERVRYVVRHFPIPALHPGAFAAAQAAECANRQGRFWEYHDRLLQETRPVDTTLLKRHAAELGADTDAFDRCFESGATVDVVEQDMRDGAGYGVDGTPTFFINGRRLDGAQPVARFSAYLDAALNAAEHRP